MPTLSQMRLRARIRRHVSCALLDESDGIRHGTAIYTLCDPRDLRLSRYVGQTALPRRRFLQHLNTARLWLPEDRPWWVRQPKLRPLYDWIRELYRNDRRLPTMLVHEWVQTRHARLAERTRIYESLAGRKPLLNVEREILGDQWPLV